MDAGLRHGRRQALTPTIGALARRRARRVEREGRFASLDAGLAQPDSQPLSRTGARRPAGARRRAGSGGAQARRPARRARSLPARLQIRCAGLAVRRRAQARGAARAVYLGLGRPRQDDADGLLFSGSPDRPQAPRPFSRLHGRGSRPHPPMAAGQESRRGERRRSGRAARRGDRRTRLAALFRRIRRHRHRRRDDPWPTVRGPVRARRGCRRHLQRRSGRPLQGRPQPRAVPALHRHDP
jgi:hypothetical protein